MTNDQRLAIAEMLTIVGAVGVAACVLPFAFPLVVWVLSRGEAFTLASLFWWLLQPFALIWWAILIAVIFCYRLRRSMLNKITD